MIIGCEKEVAPETPAVSPEVSAFLGSREFEAFKREYGAEVARIDLLRTGFETRYNPVAQQELTTIYLPVMENGAVKGVILAYPLYGTYYICYQDNHLLRKEADGFSGTITATLFRSGISYQFKMERNELAKTKPVLLQHQQPFEPRKAGTELREGRFECIGSVMHAFDERCTGGCHFWCVVSDFVGRACKLGTLIGAIAWCDSHADANGYHSSLY